MGAGLLHRAILRRLRSPADRDYFCHMMFRTCQPGARFRRDLKMHKAALQIIVFIGLIAHVFPVRAEDQPAVGFVSPQLQGLLEIVEIDFSGITAVGRRIEIGNSHLDVLGYRCRIDRYEAEMIDNRTGYFGERWLFSNDLKSAGLRKAPDFYPDWLKLELSRG